MFDSSATPWTLAQQAPLSMGFPRQEYWSGLPCPPPGDFSHPGIKPASLTSPALAGVFFTTSTTWESPYCITLLILASSLSVTSQHKMAAGAPAITCIFDQEEVRDRTRAPPSESAPFENLFLKITPGTSVHISLARNLSHGPFLCPSGLPSEEPSSELSYLLHEHFQLCMNQLDKFRKCERIMQCQGKVDPN